MYRKFNVQEEVLLNDVQTGGGGGLGAGSAICCTAVRNHLSRELLEIKHPLPPTHPPVQIGT